MRVWSLIFSLFEQRKNLRYTEWRHFNWRIHLRTSWSRKCWSGLASAETGLWWRKSSSLPSSLEQQMTLALWWTRCSTWVKLQFTLSQWNRGISSWPTLPIYADALCVCNFQFFTEANFLAPHIHTAQFLSRHSNPVYAYVFDQDTPDPNIYSSSINSTGGLFLHLTLSWLWVAPLHFLWFRRSLARINSSVPLRPLCIHRPTAPRVQPRRAERVHSDTRTLGEFHPDGSSNSALTVLDHMEQIHCEWTDSLLVEGRTNYATGLSAVPDAVLDRIPSQAELLGPGEQSVDVPIRKFPRYAGRVQRR